MSLRLSLLSQNKWIPRRADNNPKTIEQIHIEAESEKQAKEELCRNFSIISMPQPSNRGRGSGGPNRGGMGGVGGGQVNGDGWTAVSAKPRVDKIDPGKIMKFSKMSMDENVLLGPGQRPGANWGSGSKGGGASKALELDSNR